MKGNTMERIEFLKIDWDYKTVQVNTETYHIPDYNRALLYQEKRLIFFNKDEFDYFREEYAEPLQFISIAVTFHHCGIITMYI